MEIRSSAPTQIDPARDERGRRHSWWWMAGAAAAALCCAVAAALAGSGVFAVAAALFLAYAVRIGVFIYNDGQDRRRFDDLGDQAASLARSGDYESLVELGRSIMDEAVTDHYALWGLEWAAYGAIQSGNGDQIRRLLDEAVRRGAEPHIPAQLHAALGEFESAVGYWEVAVVEPGGEASVPGLIYSLAAVGETERAQRVIERAYESHPTSDIIEWQVWSDLESDDVGAAMALVDGGRIPEPSPWGLSLCQVAAMRAGRHEESLQFATRALASGLDDAATLDTVRYNRACSHAQLGNDTAALAELRSLANADLLFHATKDPDLAPLHSNAEFLAIADDADAPQ